MSEEQKDNIERAKIQEEIKKKLKELDELYKKSRELLRKR